MSSLRQLTDVPARLVTDLPGTDRYLASGAGALLEGGLDGGPLVEIGGRREDRGTHPTAIASLAPDLAVIAFPFQTAILSMNGLDTRVVPLETLEGAPGVFSTMARVEGGAFLACGSRLSRVTMDKATVTAGDRYAEHFTAVAVGPDVTVAVGRGDGAVELRDPVTLEVKDRFEGLGREAPLAIHFVTPTLLALATDDRRMSFLDLATREETPATRLTEIWVRPDGSASYRGGGKVIQFVPLDGGRYAAIGLSRHVSVFEGTREVAAGGFDLELGEASIHGAARVKTSEGEVLVLACGDAGLHALSVASLEPISLEAKSPHRLLAILQRAVNEDSPELRAKIRALASHPDGGIRSVVMQLRVRWGDELGETFTEELTSDDPNRRMSAFRAAGAAGVYLGASLEAALKSSEEWMRFYAADHFLYTSAGKQERAALLEPLLKDPSARVIAAAAASLGVLGNPIAVDWLIPLLRHSGLNVAFTATQSLLKLGDARGVEAILEAIAGGAGALTITLAMNRADLPPTFSRPFPGLVGASTHEELRSILVDAGLATFEVGPSDARPFPRDLSRTPLWDVLLTLMEPVGGALTVGDGTLKIVNPEAAAAHWRANLTPGR